LEASLINPQVKWNKNRIEIQKICPIIPKNELIVTNKNSMLAISINSPATMGNKISAIFDFLNKRGLTEINLMIADSLYKYTAMIKHQCNEQEGRKIALEHSEHLKQFYIKHMSDDERPYRLNFYPSSVIEKDENFPVLYENLWNLFETHAEFRQSVLSFSQYYFARALNTCFESADSHDFSNYAYQYLIEELAIFAILNQRGFNVLIYPGVIQTIYDIITMDHPYLANLFRNYMFVSLRIKRKKR
jgi:tRNA-dependent cyclodipeptide synthase